MSADWYARAPLPLRLTLAAAFGGIGALGQEPFDVPVALLVSLTFGFVLWRRESHRPGFIGWAFGTGYFALALVWIMEPFQVDAARHGWMAPFALFFLSSGLALFWGVAFWLARRVSDRAVTLVMAWTGAELLRAYIFTGFPWASPAQVVVDGPSSFLLALGGPHLTTFVIMSVACILSSSAEQKSIVTLRLGQLALFAGAVLAMSLPHARSLTERTEHIVRLVQPNAEQHLKWRRDMAEEFYQRQLALSEAPVEVASRAPDLIVWPETAIPWRLETAEPILQEIAQSGGGATVALGALRFEGDTLRNALAIVSPDGAVSDVYDKHHLVPFGEYMPFNGLADLIGLQALAATIGGFSAGPEPRVLDFGPLGKALPLICYEAVFAHGVNSMPERVDFLIQITNDAWFGTYAGPQQHLAQARMRAIEQGLPLVRAANTGISAVIGPTGRVLSFLPLGQVGYIDAFLPAPLPPTVYSKTGDWPVIVLVLIGLLSAFRATVRPDRSDCD